MLFGRNIQLQLVKPSKTGETPTTVNLENIDYEKLGMIAQDTVKVAALAAVGVGAAFFTMSTLRQVIINVTNPANYR